MDAQGSKAHADAAVLAAAYIASKRKSTSVALIAHVVANGIGLVGLISAVMGM